MVSIATLFVYFNPRLLNISPQRHFRTSRVEVIKKKKIISHYVNIIN